MRPANSKEEVSFIIEDFDADSIQEAVEAAKVLADADRSMLIVQVTACNFGKQNFKLRDGRELMAPTLQVSSDMSDGYTTVREEIPSNLFVEGGEDEKEDESPLELDVESVEIFNVDITYRLNKHV